MQVKKAPALHQCLNSLFRRRFICFSSEINKQQGLHYKYSIDNSVPICHLQEWPQQIPIAYLSYVRSNVQRKFKKMTIGLFSSRSVDSFGRQVQMDRLPDNQDQRAKVQKKK